MRQAFIAAVLLMLISSSSKVRADCASGPDYMITVGDPVPTTVSVLATESAHGCGGSIPMLRQNIDTGEVVQLAAFCGSDNPYSYLDECVPNGRYRYGLATPFPCFGGCAGTPFFEEAVVRASQGTCDRSAGDAGPTPYTKAAPWTSPTGSDASNDVELVCAPGCGCSGHDRLRVHVLDGLALCGAFAWTARRRRSRRSRRSR